MLINHLPLHLIKTGNQNPMVEEMKSNQRRKKKEKEEIHLTNQIRARLIHLLRKRNQSENHQKNEVAPNLLLWFPPLL